MNFLIINLIQNSQFIITITNLESKKRDCPLHQNQHGQPLLLHIGNQQGKQFFFSPKILSNLHNLLIFIDN